MNKFLLSLMLLVPGLAFCAGVEETKGEPSAVINMTLTNYNAAKPGLQDKFAVINGDTVWLLPLDQAIKSEIMKDFSTQQDEALFDATNEFDLIRKYNDNALHAVLRYLVDEPVDWSALSAAELVEALQL